MGGSDKKCPRPIPNKRGVPALILFNPTSIDGRYDQRAQGRVFECYDPNNQAQPRDIICFCNMKNYKLLNEFSDVLEIQMKNGRTYRFRNAKEARRIQFQKWSRS